jgi:hypothetical protein
VGLKQAVGDVAIAVPTLPWPKNKAFCRRGRSR